MCDPLRMTEDITAMSLRLEYTIKSFSVDITKSNNQHHLPCCTETADLVLEMASGL